MSHDQPPYLGMSDQLEPPILLFCYRILEGIIKSNGKGGSHTFDHSVCFITTRLYGGTFFKNKKGLAGSFAVLGHYLICLSGTVVS